MRSTPKAPNAPAIFLYRQVDRDDNDASETTYERIKILTEEGRDYANVELPYVKGIENIRDIRARTIRPDGSIVKFNGEIFDKAIVKVNGAEYSAKTFTLPTVDLGSIVEYRYRRDLPPSLVFDSEWVLSQNLFTQYAQFSLRRYAGFRKSDVDRIAQLIDHSDDILGLALPNHVRRNRAAQKLLP